MRHWKYYSKFHAALKQGEKVPRKAKKHILGKKLGKCKLIELLKQVVVVKASDNMYQQPAILPYDFCPKCGCTQSYGSGNMTTYPEHWEYFRCLRCRHLVGMIDNSPYYSVLQFGPEFEIP